jgi:hypothetical protein
VFKQLLPKKDAALDTTHHPALPFQDVGAFMLRFRTISGHAARALELVILTKARSSDARSTTRDEFDFLKNVWTIPASHITRLYVKSFHWIPIQRTEQ